MNAQRTFGQPTHETALQSTTTNLAYPAATADSNNRNRDGHILVHFNGHFNGQFNGAFVLPNNMQQQPPAESDAQIAARRAMAKRSSRSFAARISRTRSRKMEIARSAKPGITVDTSFTRHRGNIPHQVYPQENERRNGGSVRKQGWFGLGRSDTKNKGLGIMKGTPQPGHHPEEREAASKDPKTADSLTAGSKSWPEISPWDRPIPIGITVPSDSVTDYSPYGATRARSDSDATLATPSIIITPAAAMKSIWSPDTASDCTPARTSSIYSRATHMPPWSSHVPPVPTLPADVQKLSTQKTSFEAQRDGNFSYPSRARTDTLGSSDTAFEEEQDDLARKDRILSTATVFEEDDTPLREEKLKTLSVDTSIVPTPRRSQGWWNVITTPFMMSRRNSAWTQNGRNGEKTPDIPLVPSEYGTYRNPPSPSTYTWSATERSPSTHGDSPLYPPQPVSTAVTTPETGGRGQSHGVNLSVINNVNIKEPPAARVVVSSNDGATRSTHGVIAATPEIPFPRSQQQQQSPSLNGSVTPPLAVRSASPPVVTVPVDGALPVPLYSRGQQPIKVDINIHGRRIEANGQTIATNASAPTEPEDVPVTPFPSHATTYTSTSHTPSQPANITVAPFPKHANGSTCRSNTSPQPANSTVAPFPNLPNGNTSRSDSPVLTQPANVVVAPFPNYSNSNTSRTNTPPQPAPVFPPPPHSSFHDKQFGFGNVSGASRASSTASSARKPHLKEAKQHRKMGKFMSTLALCRRNKGEKDGKKKKKRSRCLLCCGCCVAILILLAVLIPVVVVFTKKKHDNPTPPADTGDVDGPTQWRNDTGYPPMKTGILTIAQPEAVEEESGCVAPTTLWSCALPKEQQKDMEPNKPDQPNFRVEITFENGSAAELATPTRRAVNPVSAGAFIRSLLRRAAAPTPSPAVPGLADQKFLGQTTDGNTAPFEGETTPFFLTFQDPTKSWAASSRLAKRAGNDDDPNDPTNITLVIPPPSLLPDGTAAPANLVPLPSSQPLRLFNRGKATEHYGFYTYFDRSIFLKDINVTSDRGGNPADVNGGSLRDAASLRCTFTQTRFLVQIWTRSATTKPLLEGSAQNTSDAALGRPGTFPYPVTLTLDRHGGNATKKNAFCYRMEKDGRIVDKSENKFFQFEDRGFGGNLVNGTQGRPGAKGPIDGGSGGCKCKWQNWLD